MSEANRVNPPKDPPKPDEKVEKAEKTVKVNKSDRPIDPATGEPYKKGEIPPGCNEPLD